MDRWSGKAVAVLAGAAGLTAVTVGTAQAHVRVAAPRAVVGQPATLDFRVPSEEQVAPTVRVSITVPADVTIGQVPQPAGWIGLSARDSDGDTVLTWTSQGTGLAAAQAADFIVGTAGLPDRTTISFDVVQTYSNGDTVFWNQRQAGSAEPPFPAPTLQLAGATSAAAADEPGLTPAPAAPVRDGTAPAAPAPAPQVTATPQIRRSGIPGWVLGLATGGSLVIGLVIGAATLWIRRRPSAPIG